MRRYKSFVFISLPEDEITQKTKMLASTEINGNHHPQKQILKDEEKKLANHDENQYLNLIKYVMEHGKRKSDRTGKNHYNHDHQNQH